VDIDRGIERRAITAALARMIADAAMHRRQRVVAYKDFPRRAKLAGLRQCQPGLDLLPCRTGVVARGSRSTKTGRIVRNGPVPRSPVRSIRGVMSLSFCSIPIALKRSFPQPSVGRRPIGTSDRARAYLWRTSELASLIWVNTGADRPHGN
jgi:hypothetical protein